MLLDAVATLEDGVRPVVYSDRGCRYRVRDGSASTRNMVGAFDECEGLFPDNTAAEVFFGRLKNKFLYGCDWRGVSYDEFRGRLAAYLTHCNETRIKKSLGWMSPVQCRRSLGLVA